MGLSAMELGRLAKVEGCPVRPGKRGAEFGFPDMVLWWGELKARRAEERAAPTSLDDAELRKAAAEAELAEHKVLTARGQLMTTDVHDQVLVTILGRLNARLGAFAGRLAPVVLAKSPDGAVAVRAALEDGVEELKAELRRDIEIKEAA
jgi:hypothetical protein